MGQNSLEQSERSYTHPNQPFLAQQHLGGAPEEVKLAKSPSKGAIENERGLKILQSPAQSLSKGSNAQLFFN